LIHKTKKFKKKKGFKKKKKKAKKYTVVKVKLGYVVLSMKAYRGSRGEAPPILNLSITWRL